METQQKFTPGELVAAAGTTVLALPSIVANSANVGYLVWVGALGTGFYFLRRSEVFQRWCEDTIDNYDAPEPVTRLLTALPVPPAHTGRPALPAPPDRPTKTLRAERQKEEVNFFERLNRMVEVGEPEEIPPPKQRPKSEVPKRNSNPQPVRPIADVTDEDEDWLNQKQPKLEALMPIRTLCDELNSNVDDYPHVAIFGDSGSGKTVLAQLLIGTRGGKVVILDPKRPQGWKGAKWGGLPYVSRAEDGSYKPMVDALQSVVREMNSRYRRQEEADEPFDQLTVILDEAKNCVEECAELASLYRRIVSIGREANVRLILLSTTDRARKLGFDGEADSLGSFASIRLGNFALKVLPEIEQAGAEKYLWSVVNLGRWRPFDSRKTLKLVQRLNVSKSFSWSGVAYNCQLEVSRINDEEEPEEPLEVQSTSKSTSNVVRFPSGSVLPAHQSARKPQRGMVSSGSTSDVLLEELLRQQNAVDSGLTKPLPIVTPKTNETLDYDLKSALSQWRDTPLEEREVIQKVLQLMKRGVTKSAAFNQVAKVTGGSKYIRLSRLYDAAVLIRSRVKG